MLKENHGEVREALLYGLEVARAGSRPDVVEVDKRHGRVEVREYTWVQADEEMQAYLERDYGWPEVRWYGRVRRRRQLLHQSGQSTEEVIVIYGGNGGPQASPQQLSEWTRSHWSIENRVFWVLDVTYQEDRNHARRIGRALHTLRGLAISLIRQQGFRYVPDGHRAAAARPDRGLAWISPG